MPTFRPVTVVTFGALLAAVATARAADPIDPSPLVNDQTIWVARIDLTKLHLPAAAAWLEQTLQTANVPTDLIGPMTKPMTSNATTGQQTIDALVKAGVSRVVVVMNLPEKMPGTAPHVMIAMAAPAEADAVSAVLTPLGMTSSDITPGDASQALTVWQPRTSDANYLGALTPSARPELLAAINGHDADVVSFGLAASDSAIKAMSAAPNYMLPPLPPPVSPLDNLKNVAIHVNTDAGPHLTLVAEAKSAEQVTNFLKTGPKAMTDIVAALPLTTAGNTITIDLHQAEAERLAAAAVPSLTLAKKQAERVQSMSNMRQLLMATMMYANDNHGAVAPTLDALAKYLGSPAGTIPPNLLTDPQRPELGTKGYVYVPPIEGKLQKVKKSPDRLVLYEAGDFGQGVSVGFCDGHVEFVRDQVHFKQLLTDAGVPATQPAP